jgi:hypothetical protein
MDETMAAKLKAELVELNAKCLLARDNEIRHALQRSRLEAERAETMVKLMDAYGRRDGALVTLPAALPYAVRFTDAAVLPPLQPPRVEDDYRVKLAAAAPQRRKLRPDGLPTTTDMIVTALREVGKPSRPIEITNFIRARWWPSVTNETVCPTVCRMAKDGRLTHAEGRYFLNGKGNNGGSHE